MQYHRHATLVNGVVDTGAKTVDARSLTVDSADVNYTYPPEKWAKDYAKAHPVPPDTLPKSALDSIPWTVKADSIKLTNSLKGSESQLSEEVIKHLKRAEFGLGVGLGVNIYKFQIAAKYNWNFGAIADASSADYTTLQGKPRTFEISVGFVF